MEADVGWWAIHEIATGRLESIAQVIADDATLAARGLTKKSIPGPAGNNEIWDEPTLAFVQRPAKVFIDRLNDLIAKPNFMDVWNTLTPPQKTKAKNAIIWLLGKRRYRLSEVPPELE